MLFIFYMMTSSVIAQQQFIDCKRLAGLWEFLSNSYPALGDHLFSVALGRLEATASNNQRSPEAARLIDQLLAEADRVARDRSATHQVAAAASSTSNTNGLNSLHMIGAGRSSGWLARVVANPAYAKIVQQHLIHQQQQQYHNRASAARHRFSSSLTQKQADAPKASVSSASATASASSSSASSSSSSSTLSATATAASEETSYGRVIHYPHEFGDQQTSRTLDILHTLGGHQSAGQQQPPDMTNDISSGGGAGRTTDLIVAAPLEPLESNQIPLVQAAEPSEADSARQRASSTSSSASGKW